MQLSIKESKHQVIQFHCIEHQEALYAQDSSKKLDKTLKDVTNTVNFIMVRALNCSQFQALFEEIHAKYKCLLKYNNVRRLSRGRVLKRFVVCLDEIRQFMNENGQDYS